MSTILQIVYFLKELGVEYRLLKEAACDLVDENAALYSEMNKRDSFCIRKDEMLYCTNDRMNPAGQLGPYMWQDLWAAKHIYKRKPFIHYDIGSRIDGFITHLMLWGQNVKMIDIRPMKNLEGIDFIQADATNLTGLEDNSIDSLSALCSLEHFGLGRYGDSIDPEGCFKAFDAIERKMKCGGEILIAVPVGREHVEFNAHRIFNAQTVIESFKKCELLEYSAALEDRVEYNIDIHKYDQIPERGSGVFGLFRMRKND